MANDSLHAKHYLESLSSNIKVLRHPPKKLFLWSHHEKSIVIDQRIGYIGGVDLCYGRFEKEEEFSLSEPQYKKSKFDSHI